MSELTKALVALQANLPVIVKGNQADVPTKNGGSYSYKYADLTEVSDALLPAITEHGMAFTSCPTLRDDGQFVLAYQLRHISGETVGGDYPLPLQGGPQAQGSAITYARRYAICAVTGVAPEDDDGQAAQKAATAPPKPVDLSQLEGAIIAAQDMGLSGKWDETREYAGRSQAHADKAVAALKERMANADEETPA